MSTKLTLEQTLNPENGYVTPLQKNQGQIVRVTISKTKSKNSPSMQQAVFMVLPKDHEIVRNEANRAIPSEEYEILRVKEGKNTLWPTDKESIDNLSAQFINSSKNKHLLGQPPESNAFSATRELIEHRMDDLAKIQYSKNTNQDALDAINNENEGLLRVMADIMKFDDYQENKHNFSFEAITHAHNSAVEMITDAYKEKRLLTKEELQAVQKNFSLDTLARPINPKVDLDTQTRKSIFKETSSSLGGGKPASKDAMKQQFKNPKKKGGLGGIDPNPN